MTKDEALKLADRIPNTCYLDLSPVEPNEEALKVLAAEVRKLETRLTKIRTRLIRTDEEVDDSPSEIFHDIPED